MKIKEGFALKEIAGAFVVVPVGDDLVDFSLMITTNETGAFLWKCMENETDIKQLCECLKSEYEGVTDEELEADIIEFVKMLEENNILE
ncbi:MAG: PqqD family protein [Clostridia bacterium]|nr:PqqD family protein [Clostridia bacterium]